MLLALIALGAAGAGAWLLGRRPPGGTGPGTGWRRPALAAAGAVALAVAGPIPGTAGLAVEAVGYAALIGFAAANRTRAGFSLLAVGLLANLVVVVADAGMPVRGLPPGTAYADHHHALGAGDHLTGLGDTIPVPALGETVSPGDLLAVFGGAVALFFWWEPPTRRRAPPTTGS